MYLYIVEMYDPQCAEKSGVYGLFDSKAHAKEYAYAMLSGANKAALKEKDIEDVLSISVEGSTCVWRIFQTIPSGYVLQSCYEAQSHLYDLGDVENMLSDYEDDLDGFFETYGVSLAQITSSAKEAMAYRKARLEEKYDMGWYDATWKAIEEICDEIKRGEQK